MKILPSSLSAGRLLSGRGRRPFCLLLGGVAALPALAAPAPIPTTVFSIVSRDYAREFLPDGRVVPETFAFGEGTCWDRSEDASLRALDFREIGALLIRPLASQGYVNATNPADTDLLILVHWGRTVPYDGGEGMTDLALSGDAFAVPDSPEGGSIGMPHMGAGGAFEGDVTQMLMVQEFFDRERQRANRFNASLLGYAGELHELNFAAAAWGPLSTYRRDLIVDLETPRYFVVLQAFDFQEAWKDKRMNLRWETRFSIRAQGRSFDRSLEKMALAAAPFLGQESGRFVRNTLPGRAVIGELEILGTVEDED
jgi:hypothetical protein